MESATRFGKMFEQSREKAENLRFVFENSDALIDDTRRIFYAERNVLYRFAEEEFINSGRLNCPEVFEYGFVNARRFLPDAITSTPLEEGDVRRLRDALLLCGKIYGEDRMILSVPLVKNKIGQRWKEFPEWLEEESEDFFMVDEFEDWSEDDLNIVTSDFKAGVLLLTLGYFLREEAKGFPLTGE